MRFLRITLSAEQKNNTQFRLWNGCYFVCEGGRGCDSWTFAWRRSPSNFSWRLGQPSFCSRKTEKVCNHRVLLAQDTVVLLTTIYTKRKQTPQKRCLFSWWERVDSNHRRRSQQIYSLSPLATRELSQIQRQPLYHSHFPLSRVKITFSQDFFGGFLGESQFSLDEQKETCYTRSGQNATVAQLVEQLTRNEQVARSNRVSSSKKFQVFGLGIFLSIAKAMAYHHDAVVYIIAARVRRISSRVSVYQKAFAMMIYNF